MPNVSIVIPVYNGELTIERTIASVLRQTFTDFEVIVVDDGSIDATSRIVQKFKDSRIHMIRIDNSGVSAARNKGIIEARADFIAFLDADDLWVPNKLAAQMEALMAHPDCAVAYSWTDYIDSSDNFIFEGCHITLSGYVYPALLVNAFIEGGSNILVRKKAIEDIGGFNIQLKFGEDWEWYLRLAQKFPFISISQVLTLLRISLSSTTARDFKEFKNSCFKRIEQNFFSAPPQLQYLKFQAQQNMRRHLMLRSCEMFLTKHKFLYLLLLVWHMFMRVPAIRQIGKVLIR